MPVTEKTCAYIKCDLGENGERKKFYTIESGLYCCRKHGQYQRRLDKKLTTKGDGDGTNI